jgi:hypothetical protein
MTRAEGIAKLLGDDFFNYCGHTFDWDPAWDVSELHCPECLGRVTGLAAVVDAWLAGQGEPPEIRHVTLDNGETVLDEVMACNASVHLEAMADNAWWLGIESGGQLVHVNLTTRRAKINGTVEVD